MDKSERKKDDFRILSLDGGGAKGVYTLGVLKEIEALIGHKICEEFDLIYGTSTGAIIAALLALGKSVDDVTKHYFNMVPDVMGQKVRFDLVRDFMDRKVRVLRSSVLREKAHELLPKETFEDFRTNVGIVTTHYEDAKPMVFKSSVNQAHSGKATFHPGFGCKVAEAIIASSAAFPLFERVIVKTKNRGDHELIDGGFIANNPTLLAITDGVNSFKVPKQNLKVLSLGTGLFKEPKPPLKQRMFRKFEISQLFLKMLEANSNTVEQLRQLLFPDVLCIRINESNLQEEYATNLLESDTKKLEKLNTFGINSFLKYEKELKASFGW